MEFDYGAQPSFISPPERAASPDWVGAARTAYRLATERVSEHDWIAGTASDLFPLLDRDNGIVGISACSFRMTPEAMTIGSPVFVGANPEVISALGRATAATSQMDIQSFGSGAPVWIHSRRVARTVGDFLIRPEVAILGEVG